MMQEGVSLRRASAIMGVSSAAPYRKPAPNQDGPLKEALKRVWRPNMGYRMAHALVRSEIALLNLKRVHRVWKELKLGRVKRFRKKRTGASVVLEAQASGQVWSLDFVHDACLKRSLAVFLSQSGAESHFIKPGSPWQNAFVESFNSTLRRECLDVEAFHNLADAQVKLRLYQAFYIQERPHSSLNFHPPAKAMSNSAQSLTLK